MGDQLSIIRLIVEASIPVQIVIGILMLASLTSWAIIFRKRLVIGRARRGADQFENSFWSGGDLAQLYRAIEQRGGTTGMAGIFEFGFREFVEISRYIEIGVMKQIENPLLHRFQRDNHSDRRLLPPTGQDDFFSPLRPLNQVGKLLGTVRFNQIGIGAKVIGAINVLRLVGRSQDRHQKSLQAWLSLKPRQDVEVRVARDSGEEFSFTARCRIDTYNELEYFRSGGILHYVLRRLAV